ncbi:MAG: helix-turn-helix transcriptional regulator [Gemmatimonadota bacterium]
MTVVDDCLPLKPVDFHILWVLAEGELHGYGIVKEIETRSGGRIRLEPGNLYRYVRRLVTAGLVRPAERRPADGEERRRYYGVTADGKAVLAAEVARMRELAAAAERALAG